MYSLLRYKQNTTKVSKVLYHNYFKRFKAWAENLTGKKIRWVHDDKGGEYRSKKFQDMNMEYQETTTY